MDKGQVSDGMNTDEFEERLCENDAEGAPFFTYPACMKAWVGVTHDGRVVYSMEKMVLALKEEYGMKDSDVIQWIDARIINVIPHMGEKAPVVMYDVLPF